MNVEPTPSRLDTVMSPPIARANCRLIERPRPVPRSRKVADGLRTRFPRAATVLEEAAEDILAYRHLPIEHQRQLHGTNPLERLKKEIKRRSNVVGIFPKRGRHPPRRRRPHRAG